MSFLHSAFTENTQEAREWLESIGYELADERIDFEGLQTNPIGFKHPNGTYRTCYYKPILVKKSKYVDCRGNFKLFKAITALRDDSDYMQWYIENKWIETGIGGQMVGSELRRKIGEQWYLYLNNDSKMTERIKRDIECSHNGASDFRKATLEELIEHFKTKKV